MKSLIIILFVTILFSCKKQDCNTCINGSTFEDGKCICKAGYEGVHCEKEIRTKFYGYYKGQSNLDNQESEANISIVGDSNNLFHILIDGIKSEINNSNGIFFIEQTIKNPNGLEFKILSGKGNLEKDSLFLDYSILYSGKISNIKFKGSK